VKFTKMQGAGNDFIVILSKNSKKNWSDIAVRMCDRHYGVGADGLIILMPSKIADVKMRLFNQDGSESAACGNGMRCLVKYYLDNKSDIRSNTEVTIETLAGVRNSSVQLSRGNILNIQAAMGVPCIGHDNDASNLASIKTTRNRILKEMNKTINIGKQQLNVSLITIGNPHVVHFYTGSISDFPLSIVGPQVERHHLFPNKTNFEVVRIISRKEVEARVWERGVGETLACGTGACAITVAGRLFDYLDTKVIVHLPGGDLKVEWDGKGEVYLSGPTSTVFEGEYKI
jgi:diaminopimelate epimerase